MGNKQSKHRTPCSMNTSAHEGVGSADFFQSMKQAVHKYQQEVHKPNQDFYNQLATGQAPHALVVSCSDSRVHAASVFQLQPGDAFQSQTVGALMPEQSSNDSAVAAVEFAVNNLKVSHIVVCGHTSCGAAKAIASGTADEDDGSSALFSWLSTGKSALERAKAQVTGPADPSNVNFLREVERQMVAVSLDNIAAYSFTQGADVQLHGCVYDISSGCVEAWEHADGPANAQVLPSDPKQ